MPWNDFGSRVLGLSRTALRQSRNSLVRSLMQPEERRGEFRLLGPAHAPAVSSRGEMLLNVSRSGIALGVRRRCAFARGEHYRISLDDGSTQADLEGRVCWTRSAWPAGDDRQPEGEYFQAAGLEFAGPLSSDQEARWRSLREQVEEGSAALDLRISPVR